MIYRKITEFHGWIHFGEFSTEFSVPIRWIVPEICMNIPNLEEYECGTKGKFKITVEFEPDEVDNG